MKTSKSSGSSSPAATRISVPVPHTGVVAEDVWSGVRGALASARGEVDRHWDARAASGTGVKEETLTDILLTAAGDPVRYADFSKHEEALVGADWLWWFVDPSGECFGLLVQAKVLKREGNKWVAGFDYRSGGDSQMAKLLRAARDMEVSAAYVLYCGSAEHRTGLACGRSHRDGCDRCARSGVSVVSALCAQCLSGLDRDAVRIFETSEPLEDLADPSRSSLRVPDLNFKVVGDDLKAFLRDPQTGARQVAKAFFKQVSDLRSLAFRRAGDPVVRYDSSQMFTDLPPDPGHFGVPYFEHVLRGLRTGLPAEIEDLLPGAPVQPDSVYAGLRGVAVFEL